MAFEVHLSDESVEWVDEADSYQQEGPMTTFFGNETGRTSLDVWSTKVASFRTDRIVKIRRFALPPTAGVEWEGHELRAVQAG